MTEGPTTLTAVPQADDEISLLALGNVLLRHRRMITVLGLIGAATGLTSALVRSREFVSSTTFAPQRTQEGVSSLAAAASQFGFNIPSASGAWGPLVYLELIKSRPLLEPIVMDTLEVAEESGRRVALVDLLRIKGSTHQMAVSMAVDALGEMVAVSEASRLGGVTIKVRSKWPSVSFALANRVVERVDEFNLEVRRSKAIVERQFAEGQVMESERVLRNAEDKLQTFLQANRDIGGSPGLGFERDRLLREVTRRNQLYTSWLQSREEARIREIRDTPVITVFEAPRIALQPESRKLAQKTILGAFIAFVLGAVLAFLLEGLGRAKRSNAQDAIEFFKLIERTTPKALKRKIAPD